MFTSSSQRNVSDFYRARQVLDRRIHILGLGAVGRFIAHCLRGVPKPPPVTLIFHNWETWNKWKESAQKIQLVTDGNSEKHEGYDAELAYLRRRYHGKEVQTQGETTNNQGTGAPAQDGESTEPISSLIVCTRSNLVLQALAAVKYRLNKDSVILFLQNGMGTVDEVNREIFPDPETRPRYMVGVNTHATYAHPDDLFSATYTGFGTLSLGLLPHEREHGNAPYSPLEIFSSVSPTPVSPTHAANPYPDTPESRAATFAWTPIDRYLLRTLLRIPLLCATAFSPPDLLQLQLEKLAINSIINPLTVMLDARNGSLLYNYAITRTIRLLLSEISLIIRSLPELQYIPNVAQRFDPGRLETMVVSTAHRTRDNISRMLSDVRNGRQTEVEYMNGWIVKKGEEQGVRCLMNYMMLNLVKGKGVMIQMEIGEDIPYLDDRVNEGSVDIKGDARGSGESVTSDGGMER